MLTPVSRLINIVKVGSLLQTIDSLMEKRCKSLTLAFITIVNVRSQEYQLCVRIDRGYGYWSP